MRCCVSERPPRAGWFGPGCIVLLVSLLAPSQADAESWSSAWNRRYQRVANGIQRRCTRQWIRSQLVSADDLRHYGLYIHCDLATAPPDLPMVVFIHGFNSTPDRNQPILNPVREAGFPTAMFAYPNDDKIERSAALLSHELKRVARCFPSRDVALVTHSMGGLVARASVEDPGLDPGNVKRLVMIAPPTHGTRLASFATGTDLYEYTFLAGTTAPWSADQGLDCGRTRRGHRRCPSEFTVLEATQRPPPESTRPLHGAARISRLRHPAGSQRGPPDRTADDVVDSLDRALRPALRPIAGRSS